MIYLQLFIEFFKTGLFAVGGGLATLPFLFNMAESTGWFTADTIMDMIAISESTPGPIGVNMATYAGFTTAGIFGTLSATIGLVCPSVIVIILIYKILEKFKGSSLVNNVFYGLRPAVAGLVACAGLKFDPSERDQRTDLFADCSAVGRHSPLCCSVLPHEKVQNTPDRMDRCVCSDRCSVPVCCIKERLPLRREPFIYKFPVEVTALFPYNI